MLGPGRRGLAGGAGGAGLRTGRHRPVRPMRAAAAVGSLRRLGDQWDDLPEELRGAVGRVAHALPGGRACSPTGWSRCRSRGRVRPGDVAAYRIAVTRLDQESAEVLMEIIGLAILSDGEGLRFKRAVEEHWRYARSRHRGVGEHRGAAHPARPSPVVGRDHRTERRGARVRAPARQALESAGGDELVQLAEADPERRGDLVAPVLTELGAWELESPVERRRTGGRRGAVPQRRLLGGGVPGGRAARPVPPTSTWTDW